MEVKTFRARSIQEALQYVRQELGMEAAVLSTREVRSGVWDWLRGESQVEVTAATDVPIANRLPPITPAPQPPHGSEPTTIPAANITSTTTSTPDTNPSPSDKLRTPETWSDRLRRESRLELHKSAAPPSLIEQLCREQHESAGERRHLQPTLPLLTALLAAELPEEMARELVERTHAGLSVADRDDELLLQARLLRLLEEEIRVTGPIRVLAGQQRIIALVGPTGVGKTTTSAKLAAQFQLHEQLHVGLLTVDSPRNVGADQLRTYAQRLGTPWEVATNSRELQTALERLQHCDLILIDTVGRSPADTIRLQELKSLLAEATTDEIHLVLSSTTSPAQMRKSIEQFGRLGLDSLIVTKTDEASSLGQVIACQRATRLPLSYLTMGREVSDNLEVVDRRKLARRLLASSEGGW